MKHTPWSKEELKIYILLLCANSDLAETSEEIDFIKSKTDAATFDKMRKEFNADSEEMSFEKIEAAIAIHHYDDMELSNLRKEMHEVFISDNNFAMKERYLNQILDNILY